MVLVVENNGYAISVPAEKEVAVRDVAVQAAGYDMPGVIVEGTDVLGCYLAMRDAVARALAGDGPTLIEAKVTRLTGHSSDDQQSKYRTEADLAEGRGRDPLPAFRDELRAAGVLDASTEAAIAAEVRALVDDATDFAEAAAEPDPATLTCHVYAEPAEVSTPAMPATPATSTAPAPPSGRERN
jgi:2-oxoisovalerate dehydrogenase E1 component alpha subunit